MSNLRFRFLAEAAKKKAIPVIPPSEPIIDHFGEKVFNRQKMSRYLSRETAKMVCDAIDNGSPLDRNIASHVAAGMKRWAFDNGATHYAHWFHPLTEGTAQKHDAFLQKNNEGEFFEDFVGPYLVQQEPDASSFPSGGIRNTFEARGYTAWDPTSPAFIFEDTLCIPSVFISYTGESLDYKTPLLKSINVLNQAAVNVCKFFNDDVRKVNTYLGWEQEFFLIDDGLYAARPDLKLTGRTLMGHLSAKNQQLEDHYFGAIPTRVMSFMREVEFEAYQYGIPLKTRHNEVAPNQFEFAPIFEELNLANDHNQLLLMLMKRIARKHGFRVLFHEKPFAGVNGSGKHCNWSLGTSCGIPLLAPGKTPHENLRFLTFLVNILAAVYKHHSLLKASILDAQNVQRLGGNEAPPMIISVFLGDRLTSLLEELEKSHFEEANRIDAGQLMKLAIMSIPELLRDNSDRNRTSPFAFTGNRFEFRAVGSSANCASSMMMLNTAVASQLKNFHGEVEAKIQSGVSKEKAIFTVLQSTIHLAKPIIFNGNGYHANWRKEAAERGLDCSTNLPFAYDAFVSPESLKLFNEMQVFSEVELKSRNDVKWEMYTKKVQIEARVLGDLAMNHIIPVATRYQTKLLVNLDHLKKTVSPEKFEKLSSVNRKLIEKIAGNIEQIHDLVEQLTQARAHAYEITNEREKAICYFETVAPLMNRIREPIDELEMTVADNLWPLPKYREMLFVR